MKKAPAGGPFSVRELAFFDWQSEDTRSLGAGQAAPALPLDPDDDPQPVAWSRLCPIVRDELRRIWRRLHDGGVPLPYDETIDEGRP